MPPHEPCRGLKEETDLSPPAVEPMLVEPVEASSASTLLVGTPPDAVSKKEYRLLIACQ